MLGLTLTLSLNLCTATTALKLGLGPRLSSCRACHPLASASLACETTQGEALASLLASTADYGEARSAWVREL